MWRETMINTLRIALFSTVFFLTSCTIPDELELFNNAGEPLSVSVGSTVTTIEPGRSAKFNKLSIHRVTITIGCSSRAYEVADLPLSNIVQKGWGPFARRIFHAQVEPDGRIWAVSPDQDYPVRDFISQPEGFPIVPITT